MLTAAPVGGAGLNPGTSGSTSQSQSSTGIVPGMMDLYNNALNLNAQNYQNILGAYNQGSQALNASLPGIYSGYGQLGGQIANTLGQGSTGWGVATPAAQAIAQSFANQQGSSQQQMINAGLGNTTALQNATNQNTLFAGQAYGSLGAQLAQTYAGYQAQTGMAGLAAQMQGLGMQSGLLQNEGQTLASQKYALPNVLGNFSNSTSTSLANQNPNRTGGIMGGSGGNPNPMTTSGGDISDAAWNSSTTGRPDSSGYNPYFGTPQGPGNGAPSGGGANFPIGTPSGMGSNLGNTPIGNTIGAAIQDASNVAQYGNNDNPNINWDFFSGQ
jgi:hypothetical protein